MGPGFKALHKAIAVLMDHGNLSVVVAVAAPSKKIILMEAGAQDLPIPTRDALRSGLMDITSSGENETKRN